MFRTKTIFVSLFLVFLSHPVLSQNSLIGIPNIIDGDTLTIANTRVRLHGIDAPELRQSCNKNRKEYQCGRLAKIALKRKIGAAKIRCYTHGTDRYKRLISVCYQNKLNLNYWMVKSGWALAYRRYSSAYTDAELAARSNKLGIWGGEFTIPSAWRKGKRLRKHQISRGNHQECRIKGNISRSGSRIYHKPEDRNYSKTKIDKMNGEKWFCSEKDARKAGWRRAKR